MRVTAIAELTQSTRGEVRIAGVITGVRRRRRLTPGGHSVTVVRLELDDGFSHILTSLHRSELLQQLGEGLGKGHPVVVGGTVRPPRENSSDEMDFIANSIWVLEDFLAQASSGIRLSIDPGCDTDGIIDVLRACHADESDALPLDVLLSTGGEAVQMRLSRLRLPRNKLLHLQERLGSSLKILSD